MRVRDRGLRLRVEDKVEGVGHRCKVQGFKVVAACAAG